MEIELSEAEKIKITYLGDIYKIMRDILLREEKVGRNKEHFWLVGLSDENVLLFVELVALGSSNQFVIYPNEVFQLAVQKLSKYIILVHNHPGQNLKPSEADKDLTDHLLHVAEILSLKVIEHLIINETDYYSFWQEGLLDELRKSQKYAVKYIEEEKLLKKGEEKGRREGFEKGKEEGLKEGKEEGLKEGVEKGKEEGLQEGIEKGFGKGIEKGKEEMAKSLI
ncbi:MAG: JAB domain-containing protein, partial [candidate division Zixibacteria bacterium]|nr:JAB domain-containing protein [candidate division Zixibacteria bacterium]